MKPVRNDKSNVPPLRFPEFTGEWEKYKLSEICSFFSGGTPSSSKKEYYGGNIPFIRSGELHKDKTELFITEDGLKSSTAKIVKIGDLLLALYGATSGEIAISKINGAINQAVLCIRTGQNKKFIESVWRKHVGKLLQMYLQGGQGNLSADIVKNISFYFPCIEEQKTLAKFISFIDERITTQSKIIDKLETLMSGITQKIRYSQGTKNVLLRDLLIERVEKNHKQYAVHSVSVSEGVVNQVEYLGRSFAATDTSHYNVVHLGDIVYTKSPTGCFPYGVIKRSCIKDGAAVSPLYGVYRPLNNDVGIYLHYYFCSPSNAQNYLHKLIQKGAKNTINITNQRFLENFVPIPPAQVLQNYVHLMTVLAEKLQLEQATYRSLLCQKSYLLQHMFI